MMPPASVDREAAFLRRLRGDTPVVSVELRPPRSDLSTGESIDTWIDLHHTIRRLLRRDVTIFLTDNAVGEREEQNLRHIVTNLAGEVDVSRMIPFLTCKHSLDYCLMYADRAASQGIESLVVLGGDRSVGPPRCVEHAYQLRQKIRRRIPSLPLGGWANPHRDPSRQVGYLARESFTGEFYLTQVVSHHSLDRVERFLEETGRQGLEIPGVFGVFFYRSANPDTLENLSRFFPVPAEEVTREFRRGASPEEICARSVRALRSLGIDNIYLSNLGLRRAPDRLERLREELGG